MRRILLITLLIISLWSINLHASEIVADSISNESWRDRLRKSHFHPGLSMQVKYVWRGMEMMSQDAAPVFFPSLGFESKGFYAYFMGGYAINGKYAEVDCGVSYSWHGVQFAVNDYYYPAVDSADDSYVKCGHGNGHWLEAVISYAPDNIPIHIMASNYFAGGADRYVKGGKERRAYSTYVEVGAYYKFLGEQCVALNAGAACNKSCYNSYESDFSVCNIDLSYTYPVMLGSGWQLPLIVSVIYNPYRNKPFVNFTANFNF